MRKQQSTIAREYLADALSQPDPLIDIQQTIQVVRDAQLAALNDGIRLGTEATLKDMRKNVANWLTCDDEKLRVLAQEFVGSFNTGHSRNE